MAVKACIDDLMDDVKVEAWDFEELEDFTKKAKLKTIKKDGFNIFLGFEFFYEEIFDCVRKMDSLKPYNPSDQRLTKLEKQRIEAQKQQDYHKAIVALQKDRIVGVSFFQWTNEDRPFWRYRMNFLEVNKRYKEKGIGTQMVQSFDNPKIGNFLFMRIIEPTEYCLESDGARLKRMMGKLKAANYAFIPPEFPKRIKKAPQKLGMYDEKGKLVMTYQR